MYNNAIFGENARFQENIFTKIHNGKCFQQFQKNMQYFYSKKPLKSNGASFIVLT